MSLIRRRKPASALATQMAESLVEEHQSKLRGVTTLEGAKRAIGQELAIARQQFNQRVTAERRGEKLFDKALVSALEQASAPAPAPTVKAIAPMVVSREGASRREVDAELSYREAPPEPEIELKPSRLEPPPSALARMRNKLLFAAAWIVVVVRFSMAVRVNGATKLAAMQGLLGSLAILPLVLGFMFIVLPRR